jgi:hypothetical protein
MSPSCVSQFVVAFVALLFIETCVYGWKGILKTIEMSRHHQITDEGYGMIWILFPALFVFCSSSKFQYQIVKSGKKSRFFKILIFCATLLSYVGFSDCYYIYTFAGTDVEGFQGNGGPATSAQFFYPSGVAILITGEVYIADTFNNRVRVVYANGTINTFAGNGYGAPISGGYSGDNGPAINAELNGPSRVAISSTGEIYITDTSNDAVRVVYANGTINTFAGNGDPGYSGDGGPATSAQLNQPSGIAISSSGEIYIADSGNNRIRIVYTNGTINTFAGNGTRGYSGDGGPATNAELNYPNGLAISSTDEVYIADTDNNRIRIIYSNGIINTFAGNGAPGYSGDGGPATSAQLNQPLSVAISSTDEVYIADWNNNRIRIIYSNGTINTFAGNGTRGYSGDGGPATSAQLNQPSSVAISSTNEVYIADSGNNRIRVVVNSPSSQCSYHGYYQNQTYCICGSGYTGENCQHVNFAVKVVVNVVLLSLIIAHFFI